MGFATDLIIAIDSGCSLSDLATITAKKINNPVMIENMSKVVVGCSDGATFGVDTEWLRVGGSVPGSLLQKSEDDRLYERCLESENQMQVSWPEGDLYCSANLMIVLRGGVYGSVVSRGVDHIFTQEDLSDLATLRDAVTYYVDLKSGTSSTRNLPSSVLLGVLERKHHVDETTLAEELWGENGVPGEPLYLCCMKHVGLQPFSLDSAYVSGFIQEIHKENIACLHENMMIVLSSGDPRKKTQDVGSYSFKLHTNGLAEGYSRPFTNVSDIYLAFRQASCAVRLGLDYDPEATAYFFEDYALIGILDSFARSEDLFCKVCHPAIFRLHRYDESNNADLLSTLYYYFEADCNANRAAEVMQVHRNTVYYRLSKAKQIAETDFEAGADALWLRFSLKLWQQRLCLLHIRKISGHVNERREEA